MLELLELLLEPPLLPLLVPPRMLAPPEGELPPVPPARAELLEVPPVADEPPEPLALEPPLPAEAPALLEPPWEEDEPPTSMELPMALPGSLLPPELERLELELLAPPPLLPPLGPLEDDDDEVESEPPPLLCEGGAKAQPNRPLARRARMGGENNFMRVLLRCS